MQPPKAEIFVRQPLHLAGPRTLLTQALSNLLANGVKFVAPGTRPLHVWTEKRNGMSAIWVEITALASNRSTTIGFRHVERVLKQELQGKESGWPSSAKPLKDGKSLGEGGFVGQHRVKSWRTKISALEGCISAYCRMISGTSLSIAPG